MATDTDIRLRSALDANQRDREQMCLAILANQARYSEVRPRHPKGGPDGGRDIEALLDGDRLTFGAVGFANGANDSKEQKDVIRAKFTSDLKAALKADLTLKSFVFFTNLHFTIGELDAMKAEARGAGVAHCDVFDRERLRIELDAPAGFFVRFQYLNIPLSAAEQASFLSRYGDRLQEVVSSGFGRVEKTLNRMLFLAEANDTLGGVYVRFDLKRAYTAEEIGHFRAFWHIFLRTVPLGIYRILAGSSDKSDRFSSDQSAFSSQKPGIKYGISGGSWEQRIKLPSKAEFEADDDDEGDETKHEDETADAGDRWKSAGTSAGRGYDDVSRLVVSYHHDDELFRYQPRIQLRDLNNSWFMPVVNRSLAEKLRSFEIVANGYLLLAVREGEFQIDGSNYDSDLPGDFTEAELSDPWVRLRPADFTSAFDLRFSSQTPRRLFPHDEVPEASAETRPSLADAAASAGLKADD